MVLSGVIVAMSAGLPAQDFDLGIRTDKAAYAPGDALTATVGLTTRGPGVQGWGYGVKHDTGLLTLETLTYDDTDAEGAEFKGKMIVERGGTNVGFVSSVVLSFDGLATIPTDQAFFSVVSVL